ncbi:MAG: DoxX family protein [Chloroflexota bacterium]
MTHVALLIIRLTIGGLLAGHGAQKLFGSFGGRGIEGTEQWLGSLGMRPARSWALTAGFSEFGGGVLTALGFLNPIGPLLGIGAMIMATVKVHLGRPIWVTEGGAELPVMNIAALSAIALAGPGALSADRLLGVRLPRRIVIPALVGIGWSVAYATRSEADGEPESTAEPAADTAAAEPGDVAAQPEPAPVA